MKPVALKGIPNVDDDSEITKRIKEINDIANPAARGNDIFCARVLL